MKIRHIIILFFAILLSSSFANAQSKTDKAKRGEGVYSFLKRHGLYEKDLVEKFYEINSGKFTKKRELLANVSYKLPNKEDEKEVVEPLFGNKLKKVEIKSRKLKGAVLYLISGHGGPDPGAIGKYGKHQLCEDEYAYDVTLRLARQLMENGAKVHIIIQDKKDGIREEEILKNSKIETCMGKKIPLSNVGRLKQRCDAVNYLYKKKDKGAKYKRTVVIHVDSRSKNQRLDVFFYHKSGSKVSKQLANRMNKTFEQKYDNHQPDRGYSGTVGDRGLYVLKHIKPATVFIELGNIQNSADQKRFLSSNNRQALANWLCKALIADYKNI